MNFERRKLLELLEVARSALRSGRGDARLLARVLLRLKRAKPASDFKNCGTGAGGFKPGNTCGKRARLSAEDRKKRRRRRGKDQAQRVLRTYRGGVPAKQKAELRLQKKERKALVDKIKLERRHLRTTQTNEFNSVAEKATPKELKALHERHVQARWDQAQAHISAIDDLRTRHRQRETPFAHEDRAKRASIRAEWAGKDGSRKLPHVEATHELLDQICSLGRPKRYQAVVLIETREGRTLVAAGGTDLNETQKRFARSIGLEVAKDLNEFHAEMTAIYTAGRRGYLPIRGVVSLPMCSFKQRQEASCQTQLRKLAKAGGYKLVLSKDEKTFEFVKVGRKKWWLSR